MLNKKGTTEDMIEYHPNGKRSYEYSTLENGLIIEAIYNKNGFLLIYKCSNGYNSLSTCNKNNKRIAYKNSNGFYTIEGKPVTKEKYEAFIEKREAKLGHKFKIK